MNKIKVALLFGGQSTEHQISLLSARNVFEEIPRDTYEVLLIGINRDGRWHTFDKADWLTDDTDPLRIALGRECEEVVVRPGGGLAKVTAEGMRPMAVDVVFPLLHGKNGEDGTVQGLLTLTGLPFVGCDLLSSANAMDKDVTKRLLREDGIRIAEFAVVERKQVERVDADAIVGRLGLPLFVKPANSGSSVGVSKVTAAAELAAAVAQALRFDDKVLIEECIEGRELECAVLGNERPQASGIGEVTAQREFYSYDAKYLDDAGAMIRIPAVLSAECCERIRQTALKTYRVLGCSGLARIDFFLTAQQDVIVNEINTMPGFTKNSMYSKLWLHDGVAYSTLIDRLIQLAVLQKKNNVYLIHNGGVY